MACIDGIGVWLALEVGVGFWCAAAFSSFSFSRLRFSSRSCRLRLSSSAITALTSLPSRSSKTLNSSPSPTPGIASDSFFPCSLSTHLFASSCDANLIETIPRAAPLDLSICGSKDMIVPCAPKCRRICEFGMSGDIPMMRTVVGSGPTECASC